MESVHLIISGRVQKVGFRMATFQEATSLGLLGWVRNLSSGQVEVMAVGSRDLLDKFVAWCRHGPANACVEDVEICWKANLENFKDFKIVETV